MDDNINIIDFISIDFTNDLNKLLKLLRLNNNKIKCVEYYPFFQFIGKTIYIYVNDILVVRMFDNYNKCIPKQNVPFINYYNNDSDNINIIDFIQIGSFTVCLMFSLMLSFKYKMLDDLDSVNFYYTCCSYLTKCRKYYLDTNGLTIFDKSYFQEFILTCIGNTLLPEREKKLLMEQRKQKKQKINYLYEPNGSNGYGRNGSSSNNDYEYIFSNTSGLIV